MDTLYWLGSMWIDGWCVTWLCDGCGFYIMGEGEGLEFWWRDGVLDEERGWRCVFDDVLIWMGEGGESLVVNWSLGA